MKDYINDRCDRYGGSLENQCHFALEILSGVMEEIGAERTAIRISPVVDHLDVTDLDLVGLALYLVHQFNLMATRYGQGICYLHLTQPRYNVVSKRNRNENEI